MPWRAHLQRDVAILIVMIASLVTFLIITTVPIVALPLLLMTFSQTLLVLVFYACFILTSILIVIVASALRATTGNAPGNKPNENELDLPGTSN